MPHSVSNVGVTELHPTFAAEISGVDFTKPVEPEVFQQINAAMTKYGVCVFRATGLDDGSHVRFAALFGELDDVSPYTALGKKHRLSTEQLFDVSNLLDDGTVAPLTSQRAAYNKGNSLFHIDSSFNPRRGGYSLLRAHQLPPKGNGGHTEFANTRQAFYELPEELKNELLDKDYIACHSLLHSRKTAAPEAMKDVNPADHAMSRHRLIQIHEPGGRHNLYIASHVHHIEGVSAATSKQLIDTLYKHASQPKYVVSIEWQNNGDLVVWDNTCLMHRATGGSFEGKHVRDMRRATVHDSSMHAWGLNEQSDNRQGFP